jgi:hypothetical protein
MNNPNCPDTHFSEYDPASGECFNAQTVTLVKTQQAPTDFSVNTTPIFTGISVLMVAAIIVLRFKK